MNNEGKMDTAWWISIIKGEVIPVHRHELTLMEAADNDKFAGKLGLSKGAIRLLRKLREYGKFGEDTIRMVGVKDGLVRVRERSRGGASIEFHVPIIDENHIIKKVRDIANMEGVCGIYENMVNIMNLGTMQLIYSG